MSEIKWPEKKEIYQSIVGVLHNTENIGWNACHTEFMRVIEAKENEPVFCLIHKRNMTNGICQKCEEVQPKLVALDKEELVNIIFRMERMIEFPPSRKPPKKEEEDFLIARAEAVGNIICSKFGKPAVVPSMEDIAGILRKPIKNTGTTWQEPEMIKAKVIHKMIEERNK